MVKLFDPSRTRLALVLLWDISRYHPFSSFQPRPVFFVTKVWYESTCAGALNQPEAENCAAFGISES